jgi:APA family basic amino acid/polyamine antiporter
VTNRDNTNPDDAERPLPRSLGPWQATALNVTNMVGIGPFVTIPAFLAAMNGPQALIGWIFGAILVICDGLVWAELGAALPGSGGSYHFLREIYGRSRWGGVMPFLFIWQFLVTGPLEMASAYIGFVQYAEYAWPPLREAASVLGVPHHYVVGCVGTVLVGLVTWILSRGIRSLGRLSIVFFLGTVTTTLLVIVCGLANFNADLLAMPADAFRLDRSFVFGLGGAMTIAVYDYFGYYNICHLGDEVREPQRTIPRAVLGSIAIVATIYLLMNLSIIAVVPWQEAMHSQNIAATFIERLYGPRVAVAFTMLILWTAAACMFALTLGYSRVPYAAARQGDFFAAFARLHSVHRYPQTSLWTLAGLTAFWCFFDLTTVISAAVVVRLGVQFMGQIVGLHLLRRRLPAESLPFRMRLYPLPSLVALAGWSFLLATSDARVLGLAALVTATGLAAYAVRRYNSSRSAAAADVADPP